MKTLFKKYLNEVRPEGTGQGHFFMEKEFDRFLTWCNNNNIEIVQRERLNEETAKNDFPHHPYGEERESL